MLIFEEKLDKAYDEFNGYQSNLMDILIDMLEENDLVEFSHWLYNESSISEQMNYEYYNKAFEKVYGHSAFEEDDEDYDEDYDEVSFDRR